MNEAPHGRFWLRVAPVWISIATCLGALAVASPGLIRIDAVATSGSSDWHAHAATLGIGAVYLIASVFVLAAGFALTDFIRLILDSEAMLKSELKELRDLKARSRGLVAPAAAPLPSARDILTSFGMAPGMQSGSDNGDRAPLAKAVG